MSDVLERLRQALPPEALVVDADRMESYRYDRAMFCPAGEPLAVVLARETAHVQAAVRIAAETGTPIVPQGARSGLSGAANAIEGCIVVSLEKMDRVLQVDPVNRYVVTQPGVYNAVLSRAVAEHGLFYPPDPSSWEFCSIGGNLSTNSGGLCCVKYGVTTDYVLGLEVVLADGRVLRTGRKTVKGVAGYDLAKLIVGSEGTLGIITEATLRLRVAPPPRTTMLAFFPSLDGAGDAVARIVAAGIDPVTLELLDKPSIAAVDDAFNLGLDRDAEAMLLVESDRAEPAASAELDAAVEACEAAGATSTMRAADATEADWLRQARRLALRALERQGQVRMEDVGVPRSRVPDLLRAIAAIGEKYDIRIATFGHAGDGNLHPNFIFDHGDPRAEELTDLARADLYRAAIALGGTVTAEHGIGIARRDALVEQVGADVVGVMRSIKDALDPQGILNPGRVFQQG
jgi:glycolate dehydrogenase FAD-linked subunit